MSFLCKRISFRVTSLVISEYKFYVDFKGMLYFEDSKEYIYPNAIKDKKFITQLYQHLLPTKLYLQNKLQQDKQDPHQTLSENKSSESLQKQIQRNKDYPFVAEFWGERNFLKSGIAPIIFNRVISADSIPDFQLSENKNMKVLEFSLGQYSAFDVKQLCIDDQGRLWHPYLRIKQFKHKKKDNIELSQAKIQKTNIMGVFSNELIAEMLDRILYEGDEAFLFEDGSKVKINKKPSNSSQTSVESKIL